MSEAQKGVLHGMVVGLALSMAIVLIGYACDCFHFSNIDNKLLIAFKALTLPGLFLIIAVARLAKYRFFSPEDIDGSGLTSGSKQAKILQSLIQNTIEQLCIAIIAYSAWAAIMPAQSMSVILLATLTFSVGRILFFVNYTKGASARALGFSLTFYPSVIMIFTAIIYMIIEFF
jgi:uncharacterized membrane protein YecN with MAPEG domain